MRFFRKYCSYYWMSRAYIAEAVLKICFDKKTRNKAEHIRGLEQKNKVLKREVRLMQEAAERQNIRAKALNILVACDGPCNADYMDDPELVTQEVVNEVQWHAKRLLNWWNRGGKAGADAYRARYRSENQ